MSAMDITCGFPIFGASGYQRQRNCSEGSSSGASTYSGGYDRMPACGCLEAGSPPLGAVHSAPTGGGYTRLRGGASPASSCGDLHYEKADCGHSEKEEELVFHSEDYGGGGRLSAVVGRDLCAGDLCLLLAAKSLAAKDPSWAIVEVWPRLGIERSLEDHEEVLAVHHDVQSFGRREAKKFVFRKDFSKYEFFHSPQQFFPADMVDLAACCAGTSAPSTPTLDARHGHWPGQAVCSSTSAPSTPLDPQAALMAVVGGSVVLPPIFSPVWVRDPSKQTWTRAFLLLQGQELYISHKVQTIAKYLRSKDSNKVLLDGVGGLQAVASLRDHAVYRALNARNQFRAPTEWGLCLRPSSSSRVGAGGGGPGALFCVACESERARLCWLTAMRLAKYGKQLRENYRSFKSKCTESGSSPKEYNSYSVPNESVRSRVAMDFTGSVGRIVDDPQEARAIAAAEGYSWKRRWRPPRPSAPGAAPAAPGATPAPATGLAAGVHVAQPWFHAGMTREQAAQLVHRHGSVDGVFLVRESRSSPGSFVLTYKCGGKVIHTQIQPVVDTARDAVCYSLDNGSTKFYDLLQLVEFYQLNAGRLPTRLTHYVVQGPAEHNSVTY
ncbi:growth factor receptor-bound protein 14-like [Schistocerca americana]|uniref:growth factor receptor-bound protein 14-like n=1 Tax=Schistocerca americana TaxID=7009 RepID=UPI001F500359|nr:growth factor receptor-bound protein 14-like [Schistocerca americana]